MVRLRQRQVIGRHGQPHDHRMCYQAGTQRHCGEVLPRDPSALAVPVCKAARMSTKNRSVAFSRAASWRACNLRRRLRDHHGIANVERS